jgi:hypothetical protein
MPGLYFQSGNGNIYALVQDEYGELQSRFLGGKGEEDAQEDLDLMIGSMLMRPSVLKKSVTPNDPEGKMSSDMQIVIK